MASSLRGRGLSRLLAGLRELLEHSRHLRVLEVLTEGSEKLDYGRDGLSQFSHRVCRRRGLAACLSLPLLHRLHQRVSHGTAH
jgi:hypothetical protein